MKASRALLILGLLAAFGCGVKTDPYPAEAILPGPVRDLSQLVTDRGEALLSWKAPENNMVGRPLKSLGGFEIEVSENPAGEAYCQTCPHRYLKADMVSALTPPPGLTVAPGPYQWRYPLTRGKVYRFRVMPLAENGSGHPQARREAVVWALANPGPLGGFGATLGDKAVELGWNAPGAGLAAEVEKLGDDGQWRPLSGFDGAAARHVDYEVQYDKTYVYRGRLARWKDQTRAVGPWSPPVSLTVIDITPPNPPGFVDAALASGGVRLSWESLAFDPDLAGYRLYRKLSDESVFSRIGGPLLKANSFFDSSVPAGGAAQYRVTSVDGSPRANESAPSPTAEVYLEPPAEEPPRPRPEI